MIALNCENGGSLECFGGLKDHLISDIAQRKNEIYLACPVSPVQVINIGYDEKLHDSW
jgi:hypothetical protein